MSRTTSILVSNGLGILLDIYRSVSLFYFIWYLYIIGLVKLFFSISSSCLFYLNFLAMPICNKFSILRLPIPVRQLLSRISETPVYVPWHHRSLLVGGAALRGLPAPHTHRYIHTSPSIKEWKVCGQPIDSTNPVYLFRRVGHTSERAKPQ